MTLAPAALAIFVIVVLAVVTACLGVAFYEMVIRHANKSTMIAARGRSLIGTLLNDVEGFEEELANYVRVRVNLAVVTAGDKHRAALAALKSAHSTIVGEHNRQISNLTNLLAAASSVSRS